MPHQNACAILAADKDGCQEVQEMAMPRVFVSFDFDHDSELRDLFVGQARNPRTPFTLVNWSVKEAMSGDWKEKRVRASAAWM